MDCVVPPSLSRKFLHFVILAITVSCVCWVHLSSVSLQSFQSIQSKCQIWGNGSSELWAAVQHCCRHQHAHTARHHARRRRFSQLHQLLPGQHRAGVRTIRTPPHQPRKHNPPGGRMTGVRDQGLKAPAPQQTQTAGVWIMRGSKD